MSARPWVFAPEPISSVKVACSPPDLRIRFLPTRRFVRCTWVRISNYRRGFDRTIMLKPSLQLRIGQQLTMTPQLQQAIRLLQLPALDLQAHVRETLETNVMLEAEEELGEGAAPETAREPEEAPAVREDYAELDGHSAGASDQREEPEVEIADEAWGEQTTGPSETAWSGDDDRSDDFSDRHAETLQEQLIEQLELAHLSAIDLAIARVIADAISD